MHKSTSTTTLESKSTKSTSKSKATEVTNNVDLSLNTNRTDNISDITTATTFINITNNQKVPKNEKSLISLKLSEEGELPKEVPELPELRKEEPKELKEIINNINNDRTDKKIEQLRVELSMLTQDVSLNALDFFNLFDKKRTYTPIECDSKYPESPEEIKMITAYTEAKHKLFKENPHTWKKKEIENLLTQVEKHGKRWKLLSTQYVVNDSKMRSAASLCSKFRNWIKKMSLSSFDRDWSEDEDRRLRIGIMTYGVSSWKKIADLVETKDSIQVHKRWKQICLNMRGHWSEEENEILNKLVKDHGKNWSQFAGVLARPPNYIRLHYEYNRDRWTEEESKLLYNTLKEVGFNWKKIKEKFPKRNIGQIRDYIDKHANVNPFVMHGRWTTEEKARFKQGFDEYGTVWCRVSQVVKSRTQSQCSNHFKYFKNYISDEEYKRLIIDRVNQFKDMKISKQGRVYGKTEIKELSELLEKTKQSGEEGENDFEENFKNDLENKEDEKR